MRPSRARFDAHVHAHWRGSAESAIESGEFPVVSLMKIVAAFLLALVATGHAHAAKKSEAPAPNPELVGALQLIEAQDYAAARAAIAPLVAAGDREARHMLGFLEEKGFGGPKNIEGAIDLYYQAAMEGSADAQYSLGELAWRGGNVKQNHERALGWYRLAAEQKHAGALTRLGQMHAEGQGTERDAALAVSFFEKAAAENDAHAEYFLGNAHLKGEGVAQDFRKAAGFYLRAAEKGHADAQYNLALLYDSDRLGAPDLQKSYALMKLAAEAGLPEAAVALGLMAHNGKTPQKEAPADWFEKAARAGDPQGQFLYAVALAKGDGREKNPAEALLWIDKALLSADSLPDSMRLNAAELRARLARDARKPQLRQ
jgi:hypothetical protein